MVCVSERPVKDVDGSAKRRERVYRSECRGTESFVFQSALAREFVMDIQVGDAGEEVSVPSQAGRVAEDFKEVGLWSGTSFGYELVWICILASTAVTVYLVAPLAILK